MLRTDDLYFLYFWVYAPHEFEELFISRTVDQNFTNCILIKRQLISFTQICIINTKQITDSNFLELPFFIRWTPLNTKEPFMEGGTRAITDFKAIILRSHPFPSPEIFEEQKGHLHEVLNLTDLSKTRITKFFPVILAS